MEAAYEESKILLRREPIDRLIRTEGLEATTKAKLQKVLEARDFAKTIGMTPGDTFTQYSDIQRDVLAWVLMGSLPDAFSLYTWWFPLVGSVPYKGYFDLEDAQHDATLLEREGYETQIRTTEAFSTLGWFNDPLLSTTLRHSEVQVVTTVLHEIVHSTIWFKGHVSFNESLAQFVAVEAAVDFYRSRPNGSTARLQESIRYRDFFYELSEVITSVYSDLTHLYESNLSKEEKLSKRVELYEHAISPLALKYDNLKTLGELNNAAIMQKKIYMSNLPCFRSLFASHHRNWDAFWASIWEIHEQYHNQSGEEQKSPFEIFAERYPICSLES